MNKYLLVPIFLLIQFFLFKSILLAQEVSVKQTVESIKTYPFSDPNPVPVLGINKKVAPFYPYFMFDGYTDQSVMRDWKIVKLENPFITVSVLPEVGGKVMGAVERVTNNEFVYINHVMKFRAIGIRGPWTSGGIEHNFGLDLGHAPWAAAAVDYVIKNNEDGSASCIVGGLDLASRSEWRVDIRLPKDKAYFETNSLWYNPSPLHHSYLSWENAAFKASNDLQFYFPGNYHIGHDGLASPWPIDKQGRNLAIYKENNFGDSKSYHVVGNYRNWFGGYWHDKKFGFAHWAPYADAPGKKLWIWSLSREGAIWEKLLTDNDGQYIEAQSGAILNQAAERSGFHSPFTQLSLRPLYTETKREYWFPVKNTGGMADATPYGTLNVTAVGDSLKIAVSPNVSIQDSLAIVYHNEPVFSTYLQLKPMQVFEKAIALRGPNLEAVRVSLGKNKLLFAEKENEIQRPFVSSARDTAYSSAQRFFRMAEEENSMRNYKLALNYYQQCLSLEPSHYDALSRVAEYYYRSGEFEKGIKFARQVLENSTYDGSANFIYGNLLLRLGKLNEAEEAFSIAARTMEYRSAAYVYIAGIQLQKKNFDQAADYATRSLEYNRNNLLGYGFLATAYRKLNEVTKADSVLNVLLNIDPLSHYARFEQYLLSPSAASLSNFKSEIKNELPQETYLELAITYANWGLDEEAIKVLEEAPSYPTVYYWLAYLKRDTSPDQSLTLLKKAEELSPKLVFPFRLETIPVLTWAQEKHSSWKTSYYLGLLYWNNLRQDKAKELFEKCEDSPDFAAFYLARGALFQSESGRGVYVGENFKRAVVLEPAEWRTWHYRTNYLLNNDSLQQSYLVSKQAYNKFKANPVIGMDYAKTLLNTDRLEACVGVLRELLVLPQEGAQEGHDVYELANLSLALKMIEQKKFRKAVDYLNNSKKWPENLGAGSPYNPDNRLQDFLAGYCEKMLGNQKDLERYHSSISTYSLNEENWSGTRNPANNYISALILSEQQKQQDLNKLMNRWKAEQDSLSNWSISAGSTAPEFRWVWSMLNEETETATIVERDLLATPIKTRFKLFKKALELTRR